MGVTIQAFQIENVKRVKALALEPSPTGLTIIGGGNCSGKTSALDALAWTIGGAKLAPDAAQRDGSMNPPHTKITLSNGIVVERKGKNSTLTVTDPTRQRAGQALLDGLFEPLALNLPKFLDASPKEQAETLLRILGIGDKLRDLDLREQKTYNERHAIGQVATSKTKHAEELPYHPDAPDKPVSVSDLVKQQQDILARNGENQRKRERLISLEGRAEAQADVVETLRKKLGEAERTMAALQSDLATARKTAAQLEDESTAEIEASIGEIESLNSCVSANMAKERARDEAAEFTRQYEQQSAELDEIRAQRLALLEGANLPLEGLTVEEGQLKYLGHTWKDMASSEQLRVAVAIVRRLKPDCGLVLLDKLEQMDTQTLADFGKWLEQEGLQAICTRVSVGEECTIIIEDGLPQGQSYLDVTTGVSGTVPDATEQAQVEKENGYSWD